MSLKKNIVANYLSQFYVAAIAILVLPLYIRFMGAEAYGLVGFFILLQSWFALLDFGLTPTIGRETARYHGGVLSALKFRQLFRALNLIFITVAVLGGGGLWLASEIIAVRWLNPEKISIFEVVFAVKIMAFAVALRWLGGLYRGVVTGFERFIWIGSFNAIVASLRFGLVFLSMWLFGYTAIVFFVHQLVVSIFEMIYLAIMSLRLLPRSHDFSGVIGWSIKPVKSVLKFALTIAFTSTIWVLVTQTDKLVLSGILQLSDYGYFSLAVMAASGIMVVSGPVSNAIMPRMANLHAKGKHDEYLLVYRKATQLVSVVAGSIAITIVFFAKPLLYAWTANAAVANAAAPILCLYAMGNSVLVVGAFPYYLQYAKGNLRYHLVGNVVTGIFLIPSIVIAAVYFGAIGAGWVWFGFHVLGLLTWAGYVHHKLEPGLHLQWILKDILSIFFPTFILVWTMSLVDISELSRIAVFIYVLFVGLVALLVATLSSSEIRNFSLGFVRRIRFG